MAGKVIVGLGLHWARTTDFSGLSTDRLNGLREQDEHPADTPLLRVWHPLPYLMPLITQLRESTLYQYGS